MPSKAAKTPTKKTARATGASARKAEPKRPTVASLAQSLKSLEARLKGADTKNRNAIKALEAVVEEVKAAAKRANTAQKSALTKGLNTLEIRMETYLDRAVSEARSGVRSDLASVVSSDADFSTLEHAVQSAHARIDHLDNVQRDALARLNRHIADLATSVEIRLTGETKARKANFAALDSKIETLRGTVNSRIDEVEQATADALSAVGVKISEFAEAVEDRAKTSDVDTAERLADLAQETQSEFSSVQTDVTARLEALEMIAANWSPSEPPAAANPYLPANSDDPRIDQMEETIQGLQDELSRMYARMASAQDAGPATMLAPPTAALPAQNIVPISQTMDFTQDNPYAAAVRAFEASGAEMSVAEPIPAPAPLQTETVPTPPIVEKRESHIPEEFDPTAYQAPEPFVPAAPASTPQNTLPDLPPPPVLPTPPAPPPMAPPMASSGAHAPIDYEMPASEEPMSAPVPVPVPVSTYADPAYAENDDMRAERIGDVSGSGRRALPSLPISGRNLRVAALAVGVSVLGLFAAKTFFTGNETSSIQATNQTVSPTPTPGSNAIERPVETVAQNDFTLFEDGVAPATPPLGQYAETQTPEVPSGAQDTLDAAVKAGNPIAQFQKGLVQLQAGQMEEGARLIRLAANRNQPAAQYRLAKLYESGTGIAKDPITARELIERAARGGNRIAMHDLGNYHAYGQGGLDQNMTEALDWFTKAAERGVVDSQFNVAFLREGNEGVPADIETALFWYFVAARQGDQGAPDRIAVLSPQLSEAALANIKSRADRFNPKPVDEAANGVFRDVPWGHPKQSVPTIQAAEIVRIRDAQTLLGALGYEVGAPDGIVGKKTREAVRSFEAVNGMPETGDITDELIQKLEVAAGA